MSILKFSCMFAGLTKKWQRSGVESPGLCYLYYICYMEKWKLFILYVLGVCVGVAIGYMMQGCKATEKCDAYSQNNITNK